MSSLNFASTLMQYAWSVPMVIVWIVGVVMLVTHRQRLGAAFYLAIASITVSVIAFVGSMAFGIYYSQLIASSSRNMSQMLVFSQAIGAISGLSHTLAAALMITAVFAGRNLNNIPKGPPSQKQDNTVSVNDTNN